MPHSPDQGGALLGPAGQVVKIEDLSRVLRHAERTERVEHHGHLLRRNGVGRPLEAAALRAVDEPARCIVSDPKREPSKVWCTGGGWCQAPDDSTAHWGPTDEGDPMTTDTGAYEVVVVGPVRGQPRRPDEGGRRVLPGRGRPT